MQRLRRIGWALALGLAILVGCGGDDEGTGPPAAADKRKVVIGIHGLRPKASPEELAPEWQAGLRHGLELSEEDVDEFEFRLVYWADEKRELRKCAKRRTSVAWDRRSDVVRAIAGIRDLDLDMTSIVERLKAGDLDDLFDITNWNEAQHDLERYYEGGEGESIRQSLIHALEEERGSEVFLIAHSMGSIIAYDVLREGDFEIHQLVTIGSPLGLQPIRARNSAETGEWNRSIVRKWTNLADPTDPIALDPDLGDDYENVRTADGSPLSITDLLVNTWRPPEESLTEKLRGLIEDFNPEAVGDVAKGLYDFTKSKANPWHYHSFCGYVQTPEMAAMLADFLE